MSGVDLQFLQRIQKSQSKIESVNEFWDQKSKIVESELRTVLGRRIYLFDREHLANEILGLKKFEEYGKELFPPSINFRQAKHLIEKSDIYKIIKRLPKGANLYGLFLASVDLDFMYELTFEDHLYFRFEDGLKLKFSETRPAPGWRLLSYLRNTDQNEYIDDLNRAVLESLTINVPDGANETLYWAEIKKTLNVYTTLTSYKPNFIKTFKRVLENLYQDNVMYAELQYHFPKIYDLHENITNNFEVMNICRTMLQDFKRTRRNFVGFRFIYAPLTGTLPSNFRKIALALWYNNQDLVAGFGLTGMENQRRPLSDFVEEFLKLPRDMKLFFSAGLTKSWASSSDYNILDGLLLNSFRIGEGFSIYKHPVILDLLRYRNIAIEVSPIANQVLNYVADLRNHPNAVLVATDFPVVIGNFGGTLWNASGLSYDWYEAYMAMTPRYCDLRCLKQLALNSWFYSTIPPDDKFRIIREWNVSWNKFINAIIKNNGTY